MSLELIFNVKGNATAETKKLQEQLKSLNVTTGKIEKSNVGMASSFTNVAAKAGVAYVALKSIQVVLSNTIGAGVKFESSIESMTAGLTVLTASISANTTSLGRTIDVTEKYALANKEATKTVQDLVKVNQQTPHSLSETVEIYKSMFASMKKAGASTQDTIKITKQLSIAASSAGIQFQQLLAGADGLAQGMVMPNSELGRFLGTLGLTNKKLKESNDVVKLITKTLGDVKSIQTYDIILSNMGNSFETLMGTATAPFFDDIKKGLLSTTSLFNKLNADVKLLQFRFAEPSELKSLDEIEDKIADVTRAISDSNKKIKGNLFEDVINGRMFGEQYYKDNIKDLKEDLTQLVGLRAKLVKADTGETTVVNTKDIATILSINTSINKVLHPQEALIVSINKKYDDYVVKLKKAGGVNADIFDIEKARTVELEKISEKYSKINDLSAIEKDLRITIEDDPLYEISLKYAELRTEIEENPLHTQVQLDLADEALQVELGSVLGEQWEAQVEKMSEDLENFKDFKIEIELEGATKVAKGLLKTSKVFSKIGKEQKEYNKLTKDFNKLDKAGLATAEQKQEYGKVQDQHTTNQIEGFGNLAGAMATAFEAGSSGAKAFTIAQNVAAIASGAVSIMSAGAGGDPYTVVPRMLAAAATVASLLGSSGSGGSAPSALEVQQENFEANMDFEIDQLNRTNELLESIDNKSGSVSAGNVGIAQANYNKDIGLLSFEVAKIASMQEKTGLENRQIVAEIITNLETALNKGLSEADKKDIGQINNGQMIQGTANEDGTVSFDFIKGITKAYLNFSSLAEDISGTLTTVSFLNDLKEEDPDQFKKFFPTVDLRKWVGDAQTAVNDYAISMIDVVGEMRSASDTFKDVYDEISQTNKFQNEKLTKAFSDFDSLRKEDSYEDYLLSQIEAIKSVSDEIGTDLVDLLIDTDVDKIQEQIEAVNKLSEITGIAFENGVKEAINFVDSIELVGEAIATSNENIKSFSDSFKTEKALAEDLAQVIGVTLAENTTELNSLFVELAYDMDGLTDAEYGLIEANKSLIDSFLDASSALDSLGATDLEKLQISLDTLGQKSIASDSASNAIAQAEISGLTQQIATINGDVFTSESVKNRQSITDAFKYLFGTTISQDHEGITYWLNDAPTTFGNMLDMLIAGASDSDKDRYALMEDSRDKQIELLKEQIVQTQSTITSPITSGTDYQIAQTIQQWEQLRIAIENAGDLTEYQGFLTQNYDYLTKSVTDSDKALKESERLVNSFIKAMGTMSDSIKATIKTIKGNLLEDSDLGVVENIRELNYKERQLTEAIRVQDTDTAKGLVKDITTLSKSISKDTFGDSTNINKNLISSLQNSLTLTDLEDTILSVRIVDIDTPTVDNTPTVIIGNQAPATNTDLSDALLVELLKSNKAMYDILLDIQINGIKTK